LAGAADQSEIADPARVEPRVSGGAGDHLDRADVFADLGDRDTAEQKLKLLTDVAGRQTDRLQPVLIEREMKYGHALAPIGVDGSHLRRGLHHGADLRRDVAELLGLGSHHAERTGNARAGRRRFG
jgi:hypothetical protein